MSDFHFINFKRVTEEPISIETIFWQILSPNPLLMYSANVKDNENADRWLATLSSSIVHQYWNWTECSQTEDPQTDSE